VRNEGERHVQHDGRGHVLDRKGDDVARAHLRGHDGQRHDHLGGHRGPRQPSPTANLTVAPHNGTAPLNVTFSAGGSDPDGGNLTFTLSFGDGSAAMNGTSLPANVTHAYAKAGNFTAQLVVSDGSASANATVLVRVTGPTAAAANPACNRPDAVSIPGGYYVDDRGSPAGGFVTGGGTWLYKESNGIPGLQLTQNSATAPAPVGGPTDIDTLAVTNNCQNGDELVF